ncbi:hypothetical protein TNCV_4047921 [Trichonephila clavipes]|nr:hypothetical protein TNCV_4047921 [Trichonephila clavipes]
MAILFQPSREVKCEGKMEIRKLLNSRSLDDSQERLPVTERPQSRCIPLHASEPLLQLGPDSLMFHRTLRLVVHSSKNYAAADSDDEKEMNIVAPVPTSSEMRNVMKSMRSYLGIPIVK